MCSPELTFMCYFPPGPVVESILAENTPSGPLPFSTVRLSVENNENWCKNIFLTFLKNTLQSTNLTFVSFFPSNSV